MPRYSSTTKNRARALRQRRTDAETKLWWRLRSRQLDGRKFVRQCPVGPYIADFLCRELKLVVEVDGGQHTPERDAPRTAYLERAGYAILRFSNFQVLLELEAVLETLFHAIGERETALARCRPSPCPLP